MWKLEAVKFLW